jgi:CheY-like chemotaxis protein
MSCVVVLRPRSRALVVEDDPSIRRMVCTYLAELGLDPIEANDAESAIEELKRGVPALVCLDLMLPAASGYAVCDYMSGAPPLRKAPVLVISARNLPQDRAEAGAVGASGYLTKPFTRAAFNACVESLLEARGAETWEGQSPALLE